jgi:hypothetical protein
VISHRLGGTRAEILNFACPGTDSFSAGCINLEGHPRLALYTAALFLYGFPALMASYGGFGSLLLEEQQLDLTHRKHIMSG